MKSTDIPIARAILALALLGLAFSIRAEPFAYITNSDDHTVSVIDTATDTVIDTVMVGDDPIGAAVHPDGSTAYIATSNGVSVIDTSSHTVVTTIGVGGGAFGTAVHPDGSKVYVTHLVDEVSVIDTATNTVVDTVAVGSVPFGVAVHPDGSKVFAANTGENTISVIDTATNALTDTVTVGNAPWDIAVHPDGSTVYVSNNASSTVSVIDAATNSVVDTISFAPEATQGVAVNADGTRLYVVTHFITGNVSIIDTATHTVLDTVVVGSQPRGIAIHPDDSAVYVANMNDATVSVIDTGTHVVVDTVPVGLAPVALGLFIGPAAPSGLGGRLTGVLPLFALCRNFTTSQLGLGLPTPDKTLDCEALGFEADPGDFVFVLMYGVDDDSDPPGGPGGTSVGITPLTVSCTNLTTPDSVTFLVWPDSSWDCASRGLASSPGDVISQALLGFIE